MGPALVSAEETSRLVKNLKAVLPVSTDSAVGGDTQGDFPPDFVVPLPPRVRQRPPSVRKASRFRSRSGDERSPPPLVRPALIGLVVPASHLVLLLGLVHRPSPTVRLFIFLSCLLFIISMVFYSCFTLLMALTVISVNANGLRNEHRRLGFLQWLSHLSPSVVCLQVFECKSVVCEFDGRFVLVELAFRGAVFRVASIYAPNRNPDRDEFFVRCVNAVDPSVPTLLCGDFNTVFDRVVDRRGTCPFYVSRESSAMLSSLFLDCCVVDIWRELHPGVSAFSWCRPDGALASSIDLIGCPYVWVPHVSSADILPCPFSDHCALSFS